MVCSLQVTVTALLQACTEQDWTGWVLTGAAVHESQWAGQADCAALACAHKMLGGTCGSQECTECQFESFNAVWADLSLPKLGAVGMSAHLTTRAVAAVRQPLSLLGCKRLLHPAQQLHSWQEYI